MQETDFHSEVYCLNYSILYKDILKEIKHAMLMRKHLNIANDWHNFTL